MHVIVENLWIRAESLLANGQDRRRRYFRTSFVLLRTTLSIRRCLTSHTLSFYRGIIKWHRSFMAVLRCVQVPVTIGRGRPCRCLSEIDETCGQEYPSSPSQFLQPTQREPYTRGESATFVMNRPGWNPHCSSSVGLSVVAELLGHHFEEHLACMGHEQRATVIGVLRLVSLVGYLNAWFSHLCGIFPVLHTSRNAWWSSR